MLKISKRVLGLVITVNWRTRGSYRKQSGKDSYLFPKWIFFLLLLWYLAFRSALVTALPSLLTIQFSCCTFTFFRRRHQS